MSSSRLGRALSIAALALTVAVGAGGCADQPKVWFENRRDDTVTVAIDGDRLVILRPHSEEYLPYSTAAWAWPRKVEVSLRNGPVLWSAYFDADELARNRWKVLIVP